MGGMDKAGRLSAITEEIERCGRCRKWGKGKAVPGEGNPDAEIVFIGEAPGKTEAETGRPFVGRSGRFLRTAIIEIGLDEQEVYITSPVKYLPLSGTPSKENVLHGRIHLMKQLAVVSPKIVVLMGNTACLALLDRKVATVAEHGSVIDHEGWTCFITIHPAFAMRFPEAKKMFLQDFRKLKRLIERKRREK